MATPTQPELERLRYWQGQKLGSRDFRAQAEIEAQLRSWHNRALHNAFGISLGLKVTRVPDTDAFTALSVARGVAYDCYGRELLLQTAREIPLPSTGSQPPSRMALLLRYKETSKYPSKKEMMSACGTGACVASPETAELLWKPSSEVSLSDGVPLARLDYESTEDLKDAPALTAFSDTIRSRLRYDDEKKLLIYKGVMSPATRDELLNSPSSDVPLKLAVEKLFFRSQRAPFIDRTFSIIPSRPLARPRIGSGQTSPGNTEWEVWTEGITSLRRINSIEPVGMQVTIDTSTAGFTEEPCYFAWLQGELWKQSNVEFFPVPLQHIDYVSTRQFRFRLWLPRMSGMLGSRFRLMNQDFATEFLNFARRQQLYVCWLGIQPAKDVVVEDDSPEEFDCRTVNED